jgi:hypothetical protein
MKKTDYHTSFTADVAPAEAFNGIRDVAAWWAKNLKGSTERPGDVFTVSFGKTFVTFRVTESLPCERIVWKVTDCHLHWINDKKEWKDTTIIWEISPSGEGTKIDMTHIGLVPGAECYSDCEAGWNEHIGESLFRYLTSNEGMPV